MNNTELKHKRLTILDDTVKWFSVHPRAIGTTAATKSCLYYKDENTGCSVGRLIPDKELCKKLDDFAMSSVSSDDVFNLLPEQLKVLGQEFLAELQSIHDNDEFWVNGGGLSDKGKLEYEYIKRSFCV